MRLLALAKSRDFQDLRGSGMSPGVGLARSVQTPVHTSDLAKIDNGPA
jgi:hypothetical protein